MRPGRQIGHELQDLGHRASRADHLHDGAADDAAIRDRGDAFGGLGRRNAKAHHHRQVRRFLDPGNFRCDLGGVGGRRFLSAFVAGVDRIMDMMRTTTNVSGDAAVAVTVANMTGELDREELISADDV